MADDAAGQKAHELIPAPLTLRGSRCSLKCGYRLVGHHELVPEAGIVHLQQARQQFIMGLLLIPDGADAVEIIPRDVIGLANEPRPIMS